MNTQCLYYYTRAYHFKISQLMFQILCKINSIETSDWGLTLIKKLTILKRKTYIVRLSRWGECHTFEGGWEAMPPRGV